MTSQFAGLMIGYSGIQAYQAAENVVANNAANVDTKGYTRQVATRESASALRTYTSYGMQGMGVNIKGIDQIRNIYYDMKYRANEADVGRYTATSTYMSEMDVLFKDNTTIPGFETVYTEKFFAGLEELAKSPGDTSIRTSFMGQAQSLTEYFNTMSVKLQQQQKSINTDIKTIVNRINHIASEIATLNKQINVIEISGASANELRDKRNLLVDELSGYVDVEIQEDPVINQSDSEYQTGIKRFRLSISNGCSLVDMYDYNELEVRSRTSGESHNQNDIDGLFDLFWSNSGMQYHPIANNLSGELKGLFELRDGTNKENVKGSFSESQVDSATGKTSVTFTSKEYGSFDECVAKLSMGTEGYVSIDGMDHIYSGFSVSFNDETKEATITLNGIKHRDLTGEWDEGIAQTMKVGAEVMLGDEISYQGIPYYMSQMNQWIRQFSTVFNETERKGNDLNGNAMETAFFVYQDSVRGGQYKPSALADFKISDTKYHFEMPPKDDAPVSYYGLTALNFNVNKDILKDVSLISTTYRENSDIDLSDDSLVHDLIKIKDDRSKLAFRGAKSTEFLTCILSDIALNTQSAKTFLKNAQNIELTIENQRQSVSGVDDDEEALDLVKFQNAYNLNAKIIQVMTEIYDRLILQTGV